MIVSYLGKYAHFVVVNTHKPQSWCTLGKLDIEISNSFSSCVLFPQARRVIAASAIVKLPQEGDMTVHNLISIVHLC